MIESRVLLAPRLELRAGGLTFAGYAAVFNSPSEPLPFIETIRPGAFARSIASGRDIRLFANHDMSSLLGSTRAGTLRLHEDALGLAVRAALPNTSLGRDIAELVRRGDITGMSFGFKVPRGGDRWSDDRNRRELHVIDLYEVSIVTGWPAYGATSAAVA